MHEIITIIIGNIATKNVCNEKSELIVNGLRIRSSVYDKSS